MKGGTRKKLSHKEMEKAFLHPIGSKPIAELAKGKKEVAILFDDMARPTPKKKVRT
jgi:nickel-dependent lactate racemase